VCPAGKDALSGRMIVGITSSVATMVMRDSIVEHDIISM